ncbi:hypothetical protein [Pseudomonas fluorescens]|uniref:hypothetical protein n=1 Tax=Pseudomonas fluorescens TaxID=294 RepID=UPI001BE82501|nr:hypothetical protein [Pseudomonas fluorescens]MBT2375801.1 hypothetical protein [Pseudomonas fluorescens]
MDNLKTRRRIVPVEGDALLFCQDYDCNQEKHVIHTIVKGTGLQMDMALLASGPFTQRPSLRHCLKRPTPTKAAKANSTISCHQ